MLKLSEAFGERRDNPKAIEDLFVALQHCPRFVEAPRALAPPSPGNVDACMLTLSGNNLSDNEIKQVCADPALRTR